MLCSVSFCCPMRWNSYTHTWMPSLMDLPPQPTPTPLGGHRAWAEPPSFPLAVYFTHGNVYMSILISLFIPPSPPPPPAGGGGIHTSIPYICVSIPALELNSPVRFFSRFHLHALIHNIVCEAHLDKAVLKKKPNKQVGNVLRTERDSIWTRLRRVGG